MRCQINDSSGGAMVEVALALPFFLLTMMGAFELGRVAHFAIEVQNAARAGASYGGMNMGNATSTGTVIQAAQNDAPDLSGLTVTPGSGCVCETLDTTTGTPTFNPNSGTISCTDPTITACNGASSTISKSVVSYVTVSTQATVTPVFQVGGLPGSYSLNGYSAMRILPN